MPGGPYAGTGAFLRGPTIGALMAGGVAAAGALLAVLFLPAQPASTAAERPYGADTPAHPAPAAR